MTPLKRAPIIEIYKDNADQWRWHIKDGNNHTIIGASSEGYHNRADCISNMKSVGNALTKQATLEEISSALKDG